MTMILDGTNGETFPSWTTAGRPATPSAGQMGYNTTTGQFDVYAAAGWVSVLSTTSTSNKVTASQMPTGSTIQVVQTILTTPLTFSPSGAMQAVTGLSATITPSSSTNKILVLVNMAMGPSVNAVIMGQLQRNGTVIGAGSSSGWAGAVVNTSEVYVGSAGNNPPSTNFAGVVHYLDSPATTSSLTYAMYVQGDNGAASIFVNRNGRDSSSLDGRNSSTITLMEVVA